MKPIELDKSTMNAIEYLQSHKLNPYSQGVADITASMNAVLLRFQPPEIFNNPAFLKAAENLKNIPKLDFNLPKIDGQIGDILKSMSLTSSDLENAMRTIKIPLMSTTFNLDEKSFETIFNTVPPPTTTSTSTTSTTTRLTTTIEIKVEESPASFWQKLIANVDWNNPVEVLSFVVSVIAAGDYITRIFSSDLAIAFYKWINLQLTGSQ
jgi:hypothetical protein